MNLFYNSPIKSFSSKRWIFIILLIKLTLFIFYALQYHLYPELSLKHGFLYIKAGDTFTYYPPMLNVLSGGDYGNACRMPGLFPVFAPFYFISGNEFFAFNAVIVVQFIISTISVYILGLISLLLFDNKKIFVLTILFYSFFYHIADHFLLADSLANSTLIFGTYYFLKSIKENFGSKIDLFISGLFFSWSIFLRVIAIIPFSILVVLLFYYLFIKRKEFKKAFIYAGIFISCFVVCESAWVIRNKISLNKLILLTVPECYGSFSYDWIELNKIPTAWGYETTHWAGEIDWWLTDDKESDKFPFPSSVLTKSFNVDSLVNLKREYYYLLNKGEGISSVNVDFQKKVLLYLREYKAEHPLHYYVINPLKLLFKFHNKKTIVDMPFPKFSEMTLFQKGFKIVNWFVLLIISLVFLFCSPISFFFNRNIYFFVFLAIPFSISIFLSFSMGAIEQRYFWPNIPFAIIYFAYFTNDIYEFLRKNIRRFGLN